MNDIRRHASRARPALFRSGAVLLSALILFGCDESSVENVDDLLARVEQSIESGDLRAGSIDLKTILQKDPDNVEARLMLGRIYLDIGDAESAEKELKTAQSLGANKVETKFLIGRSLLLRGDYSTLLQNHQISDGMSASEVSNTAVLRGHAFLEQRNLDEAEAAYQKAASAYKTDIDKERPHLKHTNAPEFLEAIVGLANVSIFRGDWEEAKARMDRAASLSPDHYSVQAAKGELAFRQKNFKESEEAFQAAFANRKSDLELQLGIARAQIALNDYDKAIANLNAVREHYPDYIPANYYLGLAELQKENFAAAKEAGERIFKNQPNSIQAHMIVGMANFGLGNYEQANYSLQRYLTEAPESRNVRRLLGIAQMRLLKPDEALSTFKALSEQSPDDIQLLTMVASAATASGDLFLADNYFQKAVDINPDDPETRLRLARVKFATGRSDEALEELEKATKESPGFLKGKYTLMQLHLRRSEFDKALKVANELRTADPDSPNPWIGIGLAHKGKQEWTEAIGALEEALKIAPTHIGAAYTIADIHLITQDFTATRAVYDRILEQRPGHLLTLMRYIALAQYQGKPEEAESLLRTAMDANPRAVEPRVLAAQSLVERGEPIRAIALLNDVSRENPDHPEMLLILGRAAIDAQKPGEAVRTLERLTQIQPANPRAHYFLAQAYGQLNNGPRMLAALDRALELDPQFGLAATARIHALTISNRTEEAKQQLLTLKERDPDNIALAKLEAWMARREEDPKRASTILAGIDSRAMDESAAIQLASARWESGEQDLAVRELEAWVEGHPMDDRARLELANYFTIQGERAKAREHYESLVDRFPNNWIMLNNLASLLVADNPERALVYAERAVELAPSTPPVLLTLANILFSEGRDNDRVVLIMRSLAKRLPDNEEVHVLLSRAYAKSGDTGKAVELLTKFIGENSNDEELVEAKSVLRELKL
ncbi:MAG: XrtA/PEP-CTERM system TPR-repeat protein PrsT [Alphaproteobacteria bacterium]